MELDQIEKELNNVCIVDRISDLPDSIVDRISDLPDSILGKILSYLPTKDAAATWILSTRWKNVFPFKVQPLNILLEDTFSLNPKQNESEDMPGSNSFVDFVDRLLGKTLCGDVLPVDRLELQCAKHYGDDRITSWVSSALEHNLQTLILTTFLGDSINMFNSINRCTSLVKLCLGKNFDLCLPGNFFLPNLKTLLLEQLKFHGGKESIHELLDGCPQLEGLEFSGCNWQLLQSLCIQCPLLKVLYIEKCTVKRCHLILNAPNLEWLYYSSFVAGDYALTKLESLFSVHIDVGPSVEQFKAAVIENIGDHLYFADCIARLLAACISTTHLYLSTCSIASLQLSSFSLPRFENLTFLALGSMGIGGWKLLGCLLQSAPNLENLNFEEGFKKCEEGYANFESSLPDVPNCLETHVEKIEFWIFKGAEDEVKLIEYFLEHGKVLQTIIVHCFPFKDTSIFTRLLTFPSQSKMCRIELKGKHGTDE